MTDDPHITRHNPTLCPTCGYVIDAAGTVDGSPGRPVPGDITGCMACGQPLVYEQHMQVRAMTQTEYDALDAAAQRDLAKIRAFAKTGWHRESQKTSEVPGLHARPPLRRGDT